MHSVSFNNYINNINAAGVTRQPEIKVPDIPTDTVELSTKQTKKDKDKSKLKKALIIGAAIGGTITGAIVAIRKSKYSKIVNLAENISFKKAETIEEAMEFGKKYLNIEDYSGFEKNDIDVLNWFNEGVVNIANIHKGKLRMPKRVIYSSDLADNTIAGVIKQGKFKDSFCINKKIFDNFDEMLKKEIDNLVKGELIVKSSGKHTLGEYNVSSVLDDLLEKYDSKRLTYDEKIKLYNNLRAMDDFKNCLIESPINYIKKILDELKSHDIGFKSVPSVEEIEKMGKEEQQALFFDLKEQAEKALKVKVKFEISEKSPFSTIYHEMGHLQDMELRPFIGEGKQRNSEKMQKVLDDWLANPKNKEIADNVSWYASYAPGEYVAEVYAGLLDGKKYSDDVIRLYKELKGPSIPGII